VTGTLEAEDTLYDHFQLIIIIIRVLTLAFNFLYKEYFFTIFINNLFTTFLLFSILCNYNISADKTVYINRFLKHFKKETFKVNNNKLL
jgi:hypothetical protein